MSFSHFSILGGGGTKFSFSLLAGIPGLCSELRTFVKSILPPIREYLGREIQFGPDLGISRIASFCAYKGGTLPKFVIFHSVGI